MIVLIYVHCIIHKYNENSNHLIVIFFPLFMNTELIEHYEGNISHITTIGTAYIYILPSIRDKINKVNV